MMKRIVFMVLTLVLLIPGAVMAHSKLETAVPAKDSTVEVSPTSIEMSFDTKIESLSNFKLHNAAGDQIETGKAEVDGSTMKGSLADPLENGTYTVKWTIIGADGHSVKGDYSFTVNAPVAVEPSPEASANVTSPEPTATPSPEATVAPVPTKSPADLKEESKSNANLLFIIGGIIVVAAVIVVLLRRRK
ncbi:copper resistance protein CopC [Paenibacillus sp. GSMTC-2017]|uniref:copper resistance CopC family protein n=1 Tax=Paenibacillus sp. GSMTC-2017 TaxID=2794350 RepID=UPI0018D5E005|nr:copper resistance protein CopC [Paenibacillus sp. GSMTC-2017]MBH5317094.1 copper resistance protein CopC [Paenibacillus sp. GSMTC-2017]